MGLFIKFTDFFFFLNELEKKEIVTHRMILIRRKKNEGIYEYVNGWQQNVMLFDINFSK